MNHKSLYQTSPSVYVHSVADASQFELRSHPLDLFRTSPALSNEARFHSHSALSSPSLRPARHTPFGASRHSLSTRLAQAPQNGRPFPDDGQRHRSPGPPIAAPTRHAQACQDQPANAAAADADAADAVDPAERRDRGFGGDIGDIGAQPVFRSVDTQNV